jgi:spore maturation protein CgeB
MLLAERPPLRIPGNFVDGRSAVLFGDLPELLDKLLHYRAHPEEVERIAEAGYRHFLAHHTTSARARQFLGHLERRLQWG